MPRKQIVSLLAASLSTVLAALLFSQQMAAQKDSTQRDPQIARIGRVLGVVDDQTSSALNNVEIVDVLAGQSFRTETSGLIGLAGFRRQNDSAVVRIRKLGYADTTFLVMLGARDTVPIQVFLHRVTTLPRVVTEALENKPRDGLMREFYDFANDRSLHVRSLMPFDLRKHEDMSLRQMLPSLGYGAGRCAHPNVYLNGVHVKVFDAHEIGQTAPAWGSSGATSILSSLSGDISLDDPLANYEAMQFFPDGSSPIQYGSCALLLWMRGS